MAKKKVVPLELPSAAPARTQRRSLLGRFLGGGTEAVPDDSAFIDSETAEPVLIEDDPTDGIGIEAQPESEEKVEEPDDASEKDSEEAMVVPRPEDTEDTMASDDDPFAAEAEEDEDETTGEQPATPSDDLAEEHNDTARHPTPVGTPPVAVAQPRVPPQQVAPQQTTAPAAGRARYNPKTDYSAQAPHQNAVVTTPSPRATYNPKTDYSK